MSPSRPDTETFTSVDAAWLHMDSPANLAVITGVYTFEGQMDFERLRLTIERRLAIFPRFRQRPRPPTTRLGLPRWEMDPDFDLDYHLQIVTLPAPADKSALQDFVSELMSQPLDHDHPLWRFYFVNDCEQSSALVCRIHHAIADGLALVHLLLTITDLDPDTPLPELPEEPEEEPGAALLRRLLAPAVQVVRTVNGARQFASNLVYEGMETLIHPSRIVSAARISTSATRALSKLLLIGPDRRTVLRGKCGVPKRAAWSVSLDLEEVKGIGRLMGGTVNDVLLSMITGALGRYIESRRQHTEGLNIRAIVPVNLREPDDPDLFGNRFGLVFLSLPVGIKDPLKRLLTLHRRMDEIKESPEAIVALHILSAIGMSPTQIESIIIAIFAMKGTAVMTNVPGPRQPLYFAGNRINQLMFWVPTPGNLGLGVSIISYAGQVILGVATDAGLVSDPEDIINAFHDEFESLKRWGRPPDEKTNTKLASGDAPAPPPAAAVEPSRPAQDAAAVAGAAAKTRSSNQNETGAAAQAPGSAQEEPAAPVLCQATTKAGKPCKNHALPGSAFCRVHQA